MKRPITAIVGFALMAASTTMARAQTGTVAGDDIFFSDSSTSPIATGGVVDAVGNITLNYDSTGTKTLYVWITMVPTAFDLDGGPTNGLVTTADTGFTNGIPNSGVGLAVNYSTSNIAAAPLTGASMANPILTNSSPATTRWDVTTRFSSAAGVATIYNVNAVGVPMYNPGGSGNIRRGLTTVNTGAVTDPNMVAGNYSNGATNAFLLGSITFNLIGFDGTTIAVQPSNQIASPGIPAGLLIAKGIPGSGSSTNMTNFFTYHTATLNVPVDRQGGDFNGDGAVTLTDLTDLLAALTDQSAWANPHNLNADQIQFLGDVNGDGAFNNADVQALINKLINPSTAPSPVPDHTATLNVPLGRQGGDFNGDGVLTQTDLTDLLTALTDQSAWANSHNLTADQMQFLGDVNGDGAFDNADIRALTNKLMNPSAGLSPVPEPSALLLAAIGLVMLAAQRRLGGRKTGAEKRDWSNIGAN